VCRDGGGPGGKVLAIHSNKTNGSHGAGTSRTSRHRPSTTPGAPWPPLVPGGTSFLGGSGGPCCMPDFLLLHQAVCSRPGNPRPRPRPRPSAVPPTPAIRHRSSVWSTRLPSTTLIYHGAVFTSTRLVCGASIAAAGRSTIVQPLTLPATRGLPYSFRGGLLFTCADCLRDLTCSGRYIISFVSPPIQ